MQCLDADLSLLLLIRQLILLAPSFKKIGIKSLPGVNNFHQTFQMVKPVQTAASATLNGQSVDAKNIIAFTSATELKVTETSAFKKAFIKAGNSFGVEFAKYIPAKENVLVVVDTSFFRYARALQRRKEYLSKMIKVLFLYLPRLILLLMKFLLPIKQQR
jgi:hypothetical protein